MSDRTLSRLNAKFGRGETVRFESGPGGLAVVQVCNAAATASIALHGGHVLSWQPSGHEPVLWISSQSRYEAGRAIRGGIPVCWPWFADHPAETGLPAHGIARTTTWEVADAQVLDDSATRLVLRLEDDEHTRAVWPHGFVLELAVTVGRELAVELTATSRTDHPLSVTAALHTYFDVADVRDVSVLGLEGRSYIDKVDAMDRKVQKGPVRITGETDRIYLDTLGPCRIEDPGRGRVIRVVAEGSHSTVVWNPWVDKSGVMGDFGDEEYTGMICVETANAGDDVVLLPAGGEHRLKTTLGVEAIS